MANSTDTSALDPPDLASAIEAFMRECLAEELGPADSAALGENDDLWGRFDSMVVFELVSSLERRFDVQLNASDLTPDRINSIAQMRDYAARKVLEKR